MSGWCLNALTLLFCLSARSLRVSVEWWHPVDVFCDKSAYRSGIGTDKSWRRYLPRKQSVWETMHRSTGLFEKSRLTSMTPDLCLRNLLVFSYHDTIALHVYAWKCEKCKRTMTCPIRKIETNLSIISSVDVKYYHWLVDTLTFIAQVLNKKPCQ